MTDPKIKARLEYLRTEIEAERISYGEIAELGSLAEYIEDDDVQLLEWAGVPEYGTAAADVPTVVAEALEHFWEHVSKRYPEFTTGDLSVEAEDALRTAAERAVRIWRELN
jgi:hypothetical protein